MKTLPIDQLRRNFDRYVAEVMAGEVYTITRYGKPLCRFMATDEDDVAQLMSKLTGPTPDNPKI